MDTCFVVLLSLVQMKSVVAPMLYRMNIHPLCINSNLIFNRIPLQDPFKDPFEDLLGSEIWGKKICCLPINIVAKYTRN